MSRESFVLDRNLRNRRSVLQAYYSRYLTEIRGSSESTVRHYLDALNNISKKLKAKDIVETDIYEIMDLNELSKCKGHIVCGSGFYSAGYPWTTNV